MRATADTVAARQNEGRIVLLLVVSPSEREGEVRRPFVNNADPSIRFNNCNRLLLAARAPETFACSVAAPHASTARQTSGFGDVRAQPRRALRHSPFWS